MLNPQCWLCLVSQHCFTQVKTVLDFIKNNGKLIGPLSLVTTGGSINVFPILWIGVVISRKTFLKLSSKSEFIPSYKFLCHCPLSNLAVTSSFMPQSNPRNHIPDSCKAPFLPKKVICSVSRLFIINLSLCIVRRDIFGEKEENIFSSKIQVNFLHGNLFTHRHGLNFLSTLLKTQSFLDVISKFSSCHYST
ncbi:hypothetical protein GDO81_028412 [Engystomops pustulosus]|uniref:Uncharacterized protein n=1 Tax=Engystomops pustulosus TaxID=76066 RepID=A0AAV6Z303_ENGPU|nr:hypothetical protein GDO81_028412 [Engystomops pustulosus]